MASIDDHHNITISQHASTPEKNNYNSFSVDALAKTLYIALSDDERTVLSTVLAQLIQTLHGIQHVDTDPALDEVSSALSISAFRADTPHPSLPCKKVFENATSHDESFFLVPKAMV